MAAGPSLHPSDVPPDLLFLCHSPPLIPSSLSPPLGLSPPDPIASSPPSVDLASSLPKVTPEVQKPLLASSASQFKSPFKNLTKIGSASPSSDGIPEIQAPNSITLSSSQKWKNHIVAYFHGTPPSPAKIFSNLNPIWVEAPAIVDCGVPAIVKVGSSSCSPGRSESLRFLSSSLEEEVFPSPKHVARRSLPPPSLTSALDNARLASPVTSDQFLEEESINSNGQVVLRNRFKLLKSEDALTLRPPVTKKHLRKIQHQQGLQPRIDRVRSRICS
ncbi:unnamed protein product [Microthlaspi erraticum]|uniref:Uncharacterized protein n=1 Tax=Microthlaspi erraticum TaxID=1685480 RepID=A0A6D2LLG9_9BRAS|nr:unnamed protein product [Microthlaspi erraticum]